MNNRLELLRKDFGPVPEGFYLIGLSGGADSVALLTLLQPDIRQGRVRIEAVHVNHGIRPAESDTDEQFCAALCEREGIPLHICRADLSGRTDEASAREARFTFFRQKMADTGADALILAHQADDQAETFLMRLLRGAGPDGLECMQDEETVGGIRILRPMLRMRRESIREALRESGIIWREDSSNKDLSYLRNKVRKELIPVMESFSDSAVEKICQASALIAQDNSLLNIEAQTIYSRISDRDLIDAVTLAEKPEALRSRVLRMWWQENSPKLQEHSLTARHTADIDRLLFEKKGKINLPGDMHAVRAGNYLFLCGTERTVPEPVPLSVPVTFFGEYRMEISFSADGPGDGKKTQVIPAEMLDGCTIRTRRPGDRIVPFGSTGSRKLQDYLTDRHIPEPFRERIPLLCRDEEVLLVCGVGAGNIPRWDRNKQCVRLTWQGYIPWME